MLGQQTHDILWQMNFIIRVKCVHVSENVCVCVCLLGTGPSWSREDGLGAVNAADFLDLPADQSAMVESFLEKSANERNPLKLAWHR